MKGNTTMSDEIKLERAQATYRTLCQALDEMELHYESNDEKLTVFLSVKGDDFPVELRFRVSPERQLVSLFSQLPFTINESKIVDLALAVSTANYVLANGCFDFKITSGDILFRMVNSFDNCELSTDVFKYMTICTVSTVDEYNDKFLLISKDVLPLDKFISDVLEN